MNKIGFLFIFLFQTGVEVSGQYGLIYNKISINPIFGLGRNYRQQGKITSGDDLMLVSNKSSVFTTLTNSNNESDFRAKTTNKVGLEFNYALNKNSSFGISMIRHLNVFSESSPSNWLNYQNRTETWFDTFVNNSLGVHARKSWWSYQNYRFIQGGINVTSKVKSGFRGIAGKGDGNFTDNGTGVLITNIKSNKNPIFLSGSFGFSRTNGLIIPFRHEFSLGANFPLTFLFKNSYEYFNKNVSIGANEVKVSQRTIWVTLSVPISIIKSKLPPIRQSDPETQTSKPEPIIEDEIEFEGTKIKKGENIVLANINFEQGSDILTFEGKVELNRLLQFMKTYENIYIQINGHTSDEGDRDANIKLSKKRAEACKDYLRSEGIKSKRIEANGYGPDYPISSTNKNINRRVEFKILE